MLIYSPNTRVKVTFDVIANSASGTLKVFDEQETELHSYALTSGDLSATQFPYVIDAAYNDIGTESKGIRSVEFTLVDSDGVEDTKVERYYLLAEKRLKRGVNSLVTFSEALLMVPDLVRLDGWTNADDAMRKAALIESYESLQRFPLNHKDFTDKDITELSESDLNALSAQMLNAFARAQMLQADYLLGGDPDKHIRDSGVISRSVGESTTFFRTTKALNYGITDRAYHLIARYIKRSIRLVNA